MLSRYDTGAGAAYCCRGDDVADRDDVAFDVAALTSELNPCSVERDPRSAGRVGRYSLTTALGAACFSAGSRESAQGAAAAPAAAAAIAVVAAPIAACAAAVISDCRSADAAATVGVAEVAPVAAAGLGPGPPAVGQSAASSSGHSATASALVATRSWTGGARCARWRMACSCAIPSRPTRV